jgi:hypothetical protein
MAADIQHPKVYVGRTVSPVETRYADQLGLSLEARCRTCGHVQGVHRLGTLPPAGSELVRILSGKGPSSDCRQCDCREWTPEAETSQLGQDWGRVMVREAWVEAPLGTEWVGALRLVPQNGAPVIAELRVFPAEADRPAPGRWSGEWRGVLAKIPPGGLTRRLLRKVPTAAHVQLMAELLRQSRRKAVEVDDPMFDSLWGNGPRPATEIASTARPSHPSGEHAGGARRGRKPRPSEFYLPIAVAYAGAVKAGSPHPVVDVADARGLDASQVRDMVYKARRLGLLTPTKQGAPAGVLSPWAEALLRRGSRVRATTGRRTRRSRPSSTTRSRTRAGGRGAR